MSRRCLLLEQRTLADVRVRAKLRARQQHGTLDVATRDHRTVAKNGIFEHGRPFSPHMRCGADEGPRAMQAGARIQGGSGGDPIEVDVGTDVDLFGGEDVHTALDELGNAPS